MYLYNAVKLIKHNKIYHILRLPPAERMAFREKKNKREKKYD